MAAWFAPYGLAHLHVRLASHAAHVSAFAVQKLLLLACCRRVVLEWHTSTKMLQALERWEQSDAPYTSHALPAPGQSMPGSPYAAAPFMTCIAAARRGIIVVGQMTHAEDAAAALKIAQALGWPLVADVLSGENSAPL